MSKTYFITDLDRTIIFSKNKGFRCVENIGDREITYMTEYSYKAFHKILKKENFQFIPCTMRNITQTLRVDFIREYNPNIIICTNGAEIYINGELDLFWNDVMRKIVDTKEVEEDIKYIKSLNIDYKEVRNIEGFYVAIKLETEELADEAYDLLKDKFQNYKKVIKIWTKIFIIHEEINKLRATDYIIDRFNMKNIITSGDSQVDSEFTKRGISIIPKHSSFRHKGAIVTMQEGIYSADELMDKLNMYINEVTNL